MHYLKQQRNKLFAIFLITASLLTGCGDKHKPAGYLARVNDSYLTEEEFSALYDSLGLSSPARHELYQQWIKTELLYQKALKEGIVDDQKFRYILERTKKELAASMLLKKIGDDQSFECTTAELKEYYENNKSQFRLNDPSFLYHLAEFKDARKAEAFRKVAIESNWQTAVKTFSADSTIAVAMDIYKHMYQMESGLISRLLTAMINGETSLVFNTKPGSYLVVGLKNSFPRDSVPSMEVLRPEIERRITGQKRSEYIEKYIKDLYDNNQTDLLDPEFSLGK